MVTQLQASPVIQSQTPIETPYESAAFQACWSAHLAPKFEITDRVDGLVIHRESRLGGLLDFRELSLAGWNNAWDQSFKPSHAWGLLKLGVKETPWDLLRWRFVESKRDQQALDLLKGMGMQVHLLPDAPQYAVDLSDGYEAYMKGKSYKNRSDINRKFKAIRDRLLETIDYTGDEGIDTFFDLFFRYHVPYWTQKAGSSYFADPREQAFIRAWAHRMAAEGKLLLQGHAIDGEVVNLSAGCIFDDTFYQLLTINTDAHPDTFPGIIGLYERLRLLADRGIRRVEMGPGDYPYKIQAANVVDPGVMAIVANPRSVRGGLLVKWTQRRMATKSL